MQTGYYITTYGTLEELKDRGSVVYMALDPAFTGDFRPETEVVVAVHATGYPQLWDSHPNTEALPNPLRNTLITDAQATKLNLEKGLTTFDVIDELCKRCSGFEFQIK